MKRLKLNLYESPVPPEDTNILWADINEDTEDLQCIHRFVNGQWEPYMVSVDYIMDSSEEDTEDESNSLINITNYSDGIHQYYYYNEETDEDCNIIVYDKLENELKNNFGEEFPYCFRIKAGDNLTFNSINDYVTFPKGSLTNIENIWGIFLESTGTPTALVMSPAQFEGYKKDKNITDDIRVLFTIVTLKDEVRMD